MIQPRLSSRSICTISPAETSATARQSSSKPRSCAMWPKNACAEEPGADDDQPGRDQEREQPRADRGVARRHLEQRGLDRDEQPERQHPAAQHRLADPQAPSGRHRGTSRPPRQLGGRRPRRPPPLPAAGRTRARRRRARRAARGCARPVAGRACGSSPACRQPRHDVVHRKRIHVGIGIVGDQLALDHVRVLEDLRDVVDRADRDLGRLEERHVLRLGALGDERADDRVELLGVPHPVRVGAETRVVDESGRPMTRNSRSAIFCIDARQRTYRPSLQR